MNHRTLTHEEAEALKARAKMVLALLPTHRDSKTVAERYAECVLIAETHKELNDIFTFGRISARSISRHNDCQEGIHQTQSRTESNQRY